MSEAEQPASMERVALGRLLWLGPLVVVGSVAANLAISEVARSALGVASFPPLMPEPLIFFTVIGVSGAIIVFAVIGRFSARPIRLFRTCGVIALLVSFVPDIALLVSQAVPGTSLRSVAVLMLLHVVAAAITLVLLTTLAREPRAQG